MSKPNLALAVQSDDAHNETVFSTSRVKSTRPLESASSDIVTALNKDYKSTLVDFAGVYGALSAGQRSGVTSVQATAVTSSGLKLNVFLHDNTDSVDVDAPFPFPVSNDTECWTALREMMRYVGGQIEQGLENDFETA